MQVWQLIGLKRKNEGLVQQNQHCKSEEESKDLPRSVQKGPHDATCSIVHYPQSLGN